MALRHIYKLCDSSNNYWYCCQFDVYVGQTNEQPSKYGKTYDLVNCLLEPYKCKGYIVIMDNFYTSLYLFYTLAIKDKTGACAMWYNWSTQRPS